MSAQPIKHLEIETYTHLGVSVRVKIDYEQRNISLLDQNGQPKQWVFAKRTLEYMQGWQNILDAMKYAIGEAEKKLEKHVNAREREIAKKEIDLQRAIAQEGKRNRV